MLLTDKVAQFSTDSNIVHDWVHGPASGIGSTVTTEGGPISTPAKIIADSDAELQAVIDLTSSWVNGSNTHTEVLGGVAVDSPAKLIADQDAAINAGAASVLALSTAQAVIATDQAVIATAQAGLATTNGAAQVTLATAEKTAAIAAKTAAESARDAALIQAGVYTTEAAGRAALVTAGLTFKVQGSGDIAAYEYRIDVGGASSTLIATYPSSAEVFTLRQELSNMTVIGYPSDPVPNGVSNLDNSQYVFADPVPSDGVLGYFHCYVALAGTVLIRVYEKTGDTFTTISETSVALTTGSQSVFVNLPVLAGKYVGFCAPGTSGVLRYSTGTAYGLGWYSGAYGSNFVDATVGTTLRLHASFELFDLSKIATVDAAIAANSASIAALPEYSDLYDDVSTHTRIGQTGVIPAGTGALDSSLYALEQPAGEDGVISGFSCYSTGDGTVVVNVYSKAGNTFTVSATETVTVASGFNADIATNLPILIGQYVGFKSSLVGYKSSVSDSSGFYGGVGTTSFTDATALRTTRLLVGFKLSYTKLQPKLLPRPSLVDLPFENMLILGVGQSLMEGSKTTTYPNDPITLAQEYDSMGFAAYDATPSAIYTATVENTQRDHPTLGLRGEWPGLGCAASIRAALLRDNNITYSDIKSTIVVANTASDGLRIELIDKGSVPYNAGIAKAAALPGLVTGAGVGAVIFAQGESDGPLYNNTDPAVYLAAMKQLAIDYDADLRAATGQSKRVPLISYQTCSTGRSIALKQLQASVESPLIYMACPMYQFSYYDILHIDPTSSRRLGAYFGEAIKSVVVDGVDWEPLRPIASGVIGNAITLTFNKSGLVLDTSGVPAQTNYGFSVVDGSGGVVTVSSVAIQNDNQVRVTCATTPQSGWTVKYGNLAAAGKSPYVGGAGNLRDCTGDIKTFDSFPLHNWCVLFDYAI